MHSVQSLENCYLDLQDAAGQPKGAGIVEFESPNEALQAISRLTNTVSAQSYSIILLASEKVYLFTLQGNCAAASESYNCVSEAKYSFFLPQLA